MSTFTWSGATNVFWATASNWVGGVVPTPTDAVIVNGVNNADILNDTSVTVASLSIDEVGAAGGTVIVGGSQEILPAANFPGVFTKNGGTLTVTGLLSVTSTVSSGGLVGGIGGVINAGTLNVGANTAIGGGGTFDVAGTITNNGLIVADGSKPGLGLGPVVVKATSVIGQGNFEVAGPSTLELNAATAENIVVDPGSTATVQLDSPTTFKGGIALGAGSHLNLFLERTDAHRGHHLGRQPDSDNHRDNRHDRDDSVRERQFGDRDDADIGNCRFRRGFPGGGGPAGSATGPAPPVTPPTVTPPVDTASNTAQSRHHRPTHSDATGPDAAASRSGDSSRSLRHHHQQGDGRGR